MGYASIRSDIETHLANNWVLTPIVMENTFALDGSLPGNPPLEDGSKDYIKVMLEFSEAPVRDIPARTIEQNGYLVISVFVREGTGNQSASEIMDALRGLLDYKRLGNTRVHACFGGSGVNQKDGWRVHDLQWEFEACAPL